MPNSPRNCERADFSAEVRPPFANPASFNRPAFSASSMPTPYFFTAEERTTYSVFDTR